MICDEYGEVLGHPLTAIEIAQRLRSGQSVIIGWTDGLASHHDVFFSLNPTQFGTLQGGMNGREMLFVGVSRIGCFGFSLDWESPLNPIYVSEKLGVSNGPTAEKLTELISMVRSAVRTPSD